MVTLASAYQEAKTKLKESSSESPALDARLLVLAAANVTDVELIADSGRELNSSEVDLLNDYIEQRLSGRPVSKILGFREFYGLEFSVSDDVLDPRPDTEVLVEAALDYVSSDTKMICELGVGSGCVLTTLLKNTAESVRGVGSDVSEKALKLTRKNLEDHDVTSRADVFASDWLQSHTEQYDIIVSNPPYIVKSEIESLNESVRLYDPILALDGGADGLDAYKIIFSQVKKVIHPQSVILFEIGQGQEQDIERIATNNGFALIRFFEDLSGRIRVLAFQAKKDD